MKNHIKFELYMCQSLNEKEDILKALETILAHGITLAVHDVTESKKTQVLPYNGSVDEYVSEKCQEVKLIDGDEIPVHLRRGPYHLSGTGLVDVVMGFGENQSVSLIFDMFGRNFNKVSGSLITRGEGVEVLSNLFLEIVWGLYPVLLPAFAVVDYAGATPGTVFEEVPARKTKKIYWSTFLDPDYVNRYGKKYLLDAPIWRKEVLTDGGIFLQLSEHITKSSGIATLDEVKKYFSQIGVKYISWPKGELNSW